MVHAEPAHGFGRREGGLCLPMHDRRRGSRTTAADGRRRWAGDGGGRAVLVCCCDLRAISQLGSNYALQLNPRVERTTERTCEVNAQMSTHQERPCEERIRARVLLCARRGTSRRGFMNARTGTSKWQHPFRVYMVFTACFVRSAYTEVQPSTARHETAIPMTASPCRCA